MASPSHCQQLTSEVHSHNLENLLGVFLGMSNNKAVAGFPNILGWVISLHKLDEPIMNK